MEEHFVNYNQALALKELGFDEPCLMYIDDEEDLINDDTAEWIGTPKAPLKSQVFKWFREKYDLNHVIVKAESWFYTINGCNTQEGFKTYEEAESECIDKLISILKERKA